MTLLGTLKFVYYTFLGHAGRIRLFVNVEMKARVRFLGVYTALPGQLRP